MAPGSVSRAEFEALRDRVERLEAEVELLERRLVAFDTALALARWIGPSLPAVVAIVLVVWGS